MGVLEIHPWNARVDQPDRPDRVIFDLDPGEGLGFADVVEAAHAVRLALEAIGLMTFVKTTGGKGLHVVAPIERRHDWAEVKRFAKAVGDKLAAKEPDRFLTRISRAERRGRIFVDYLRNDPTSTAVAPYSSRSRVGATVSVPLAWAEVDASLDPTAFTLASVPERIRPMGGDPWKEMTAVRQGLPPISSA